MNYTNELGKYHGPRLHGAAAECVSRPPPSPAHQADNLCRAVPTCGQAEAPFGKLPPMMARRDRQPFTGGAAA